MAHTIGVLEEGILQIVHTGGLAIAEATASRQEAGPMMFKEGIRRVLVDVRYAEVNDSALDLLEFNASHYDAVPVGSKIAVVTPAHPTVEPAARFAETVAVNRGIAMRIFRDYNAALAWLKRPPVEAE